MVAEKFVLKKATELSGVTIFKSLKFGIIFLFIVGLCWCVYVAVIKPNVNPLKTQEQIAEQITNVTEVKDSNEFCLIPPRVKIGNTEFKLFGFK